MKCVMDSIAIVGMACRFPGRADSLEGYWDLLRRGECAVSEIPEDRWSLDGFYDARPDIPTRSYSKWGGFLNDIRSFDPEFFGLSPREAEAMDPQQRILLEVAYEATQNADLTLDILRCRRTGVFIGASNIDYNLLQRYRLDRGDILAGTGTALSIVANRVSNTLSLTGPSLVTDTACSSSLVALDTACRHLRDGSCDVALVGGVNILLDPRMFITFSRAHMLSPTGRIRAFDADADGFVRGEGVGLIVLQRIADADHEKIYATVEATAVNQDGGTGTITAPNPAAQTAMMQDVLARANAVPSSVAFAEAHGTGTPVGDPIEVDAIGSVFGRSGRDSPLLVGSSKTNIGHLEPAAGIAGLIKSALSLSRKVLPQTIGYDRPNPKIAFEKNNVEVAAQRVRPLPDALSTLGIVNSFGFGGTNACALLKAPPKSAQRASRRATSTPAIEERSHAFPVSAPTEHHLKAFASALADQLTDGNLRHRSLSEIGCALGTQRDHFKHRAVVVARSHNELRDRLCAVSEGKTWPRDHVTDPPGIIFGHTEKQGRLAFTMTGQGGQWWAMGRELLLHNPHFRAFFEAFDAAFKSHSGWSVIDAMMADETSSQLDDAAITPAVMFAFQCGLAEIWKHAGVTPELVVGHSFGEVTAAYLAGAVSLDHVAKLVMYRGLIRGDVDRVGTMAAIGLGANEIQPLLPADGSIEIGGYNAPNLVTLTGDEHSIDTLIATLNRDDPNIVTRKLALDFAYHSSWFEPVEDVFKANVGELTWSSPTIPVISTVTGRENDRFDTDYWWSNLRYPVRYQDGIKRALELNADTFIELGPTRTLSSMTAGCAADENIDVTTISTLHRRWDDFESIATALGELFCAGHDVDWSAVYGPLSRPLRLPSQPWLRDTYWHAPVEADRALQKTEPSHYLLGNRSDSPEFGWRQILSLETHTFLSDHRIDEQIVFPAACYIEMIYEAATHHFSTNRIEIRDLECVSALNITLGDEIEIRTVVNSARNKVEISSRHAASGAQWHLRASAHILPFETRMAKAPPTTLKHAIELPGFYDVIATRGYQYGPQFRGLSDIVKTKTAAHALLIGNDRNALDERLPSHLLDAVLQLTLAPLLADAEQGATRDLYLPVHVKRIAVAEPLSPRSHVSVHLDRHEDGGDFSSNFSVYAPNDTPCVTIDGVSVRSIGKDVGVTPNTTTEARIYREQLVPWPKPETCDERDGSWLVLQDRTATITRDLTETFAKPPISNSDPRPDTKSIREVSEHWGSLVRDALEHTPGVSAIIYRPILSPCDMKQFGEVPDTITQQTRDILGLAQALQDVSDQLAVPRIWCMIQRDRFVGAAPEQGPGCLQHASLLGSIRTLQMECPALRFHTIAYDPLQPVALTSLRDVLLAESQETEFVISDGDVHVVRLEVAAAELSPRSLPKAQLPQRASFALKARAGRGLDTLSWHARLDPAPEQDEVQIEVTHAGLNFRDVMAVTGVLSEDAEPSPAVDSLGLEFSGRVVEAGNKTSEFSIGDRVFGMTRGAFARRINLEPSQIYRTPDTLTDAGAATLCSAFLTADYALNVVGRLGRGESVLIHNASGAVGLAAVALARTTGAQIFATAGTEKKRAYLQGMGLPHVYDSRSLAFSDEILHATNGEGVDIVLNALTGPFIDKALDCLAPYGRFLEIGKRDVYGDRAVGLKAFRANKSFHVIDVAALLTDRPWVARERMEKLLPRFLSGELTTLPAKTFPASRAEDAFRHFSSSDHIGKIVIDQRDPGINVLSPFSSGAAFDPDGTYLITGGARGMGLCVANWLRENGAGHVLAASRTGLQDAENPRGKSDFGEHPGPHEICKLDVSKPNAVLQKIKNIQNSGKPLKGVIHAAVIYNDALLQEITDEAVTAVLAPKVHGALNLTDAIKACNADLDFFLSFSSAAHVTGWPGQSNYTAANSVLEALAYAQRHQDIPGQCIHWGVFGEAGHVSECQAMSSYLSNAGWGGLNSKNVCDLLAYVLDRDEPVLTIAAADWAALAARHAPIARSPRFNGLVAESTLGIKESARAFSSLNGAMPDRALQIVQEQVGKVLRVDPASLANYDTIKDAGIDSLSAFELRNRLEQETNLDISLNQFVEASRFDELAHLLCTLAREQF